MLHTLDVSQTSTHPLNQLDAHSMRLTMWRHEQREAKRTGPTRQTECGLLPSHRHPLNREIILIWITESILKGKSGKT